MINKIKQIYNWIKKKIVWLFIGSIALAAPAGIIDQQANPYSKVESRFEIQLPEKARISVSENKPELYLGKWDDECFIKVGLKTTSNKKVKRIPFTNKLEWKYGNNKVQMYPIENGFEYDIIYEEKPISNIQTLNIETQGLKYYYQPPLTEEYQNGYSEEFKKEIVVTETDVKDLEGNSLIHRPENVVGSYAVYHESKAGDYSQMDGKNYRAGKAFHWYRIKAWDKTGKEVWCKLNVDMSKGVRTVEIPQDFLDNAVYPVVIDDVFGYTDKGSATAALENNIAGYEYALSEDGSISKMTMWARTYGENFLMKCAIYDDSSPRNKEGQTEEVDVARADSGVEQDFNFSSNVELTAGNYLLVGWCENKTGLKFGQSYSDAVIYEGEAKTLIYAANFPDTYTADGAAHRRHSIYCTYTPSGGAARRIIPAH